MKPVTTWITTGFVVLLLSSELGIAIGPSRCSLSFQGISTEPGVYLSPYRLTKLPPCGLEEFDSFSLKELPGQEDDKIRLDIDGNVPLDGKLSTTDGRTYRFVAAKLLKGKMGYDRVIFATEKINRISYEFSGRFLDESEEENGQFVVLKGTLTKYKKNHIQATAQIGLFKWSIH